jgi:hypothetical protein
MQQFDDIEDLELASGLKELLIKNGFLTVSQLLETPVSELASILGTDDYIAGLVIMAAKRQAGTIAEHLP